MFLLAPAKLNLCLYLGPRRNDGLHELCSLFEPISLGDRIEVAEADRDAVVCPGVDGENLAARALAELRARRWPGPGGWDGAGLRIEIEKRIPVAAGLGGGSADAAAVLRLARGQVDGLEDIAAGLGADVPSQIEPGFALVEGAGERIERLPSPGPHAFVLLPGGGGLSTAEVFAEADRRSLGRSATELSLFGERLRDAAGRGASPLSYLDLLENDLEPAAIALRPEIAAALGSLREAGAAKAMVSGSGPTAVGLFADEAEASAAATRIGRDDAIVCTPAVMP